jgi:hypothetical protein
MPIHVDIRINDKHIRTVHIGREDDFLGTEGEHTYRITESTINTRADWWDPDSVQFTHVYSEGAEVCVAKGLLALYGEGESSGTESSAVEVKD